MDTHDLLADRFEEHRTHLRAVAYRMLGSLSEAEDAVQEAWIRLSRSDTGGVENLGGWLTTVVGRVCLDMLRSRATRGEQPLEVVRVPDPVLSGQEGADPEHAALLADSVGLALLVVLETLAPAERLAFVLHDMFGVPFEEIAPMLERSPAAARQLASRARRRVRGTSVPDPDPGRQRQVVDAFLAAARAGDFEALLEVLHPDVLLRADAGAAAAPTGTAGPAARSKEIRGAREVAGQALTFSAPERISHPALVNGSAGVVNTVAGRPVAVMGFTVADGRIVEIDILADPARISDLDFTFLTD